MLIGDKDAVINALTSSHEFHMSKYDAQEEILNLGLGKDLDYQLKSLHEKELARNRGRVLEIINFVNRCLEEIQQAEDSFTYSRKFFNEFLAEILEMSEYLSSALDKENLQQGLASKQMPKSISNKMIETANPVKSTRSALGVVNVNTPKTISSGIKEKSNINKIKKNALFTKQIQVSKSNFELEPPVAVPDSIIEFAKSGQIYYNEEEEAESIEIHLPEISDLELKNSIAYNFERHLQADPFLPVPHFHNSPLMFAV
ncbi:hypothetical protein O9G_002944 [Rozella allomycis CSF55]|uniref:Uncharacterized protein n=1 Tax=Rozella allomycis (strain CSF55) TaxID=988480 RepID=A0A075ANK8_ROZAC|nr:hypothetical protein O9G_002944 [Rozella allomycis CSF55]|eukprot:EPZ31475.1 hypothetical protein O9G_002944 [Rozella allomycis CSF55]